MAFLTGTATTTDWSTLTNAISSSLSANEVLGVMGTIVASGAGLVLVWFGGRKIVNAVISAFKSGKIKF
jgi:hypothetical protein